jgi:uncharacterized membrane protein YjjB (DUF3815 family)
MFPDVLQVFMGMLGSIGFAVLYQIHGLKLLAIMVGGGSGWSCYLIARECGLGVGTSLFIGTFCVASMSAIMARLGRAPVLIFLIPMTIPMIPGSDLFYTMQALVTQSSDFEKLLEKVVMESFSMAMGIASSSYVVRLILKIRHTLKSF